MNQRGFILPISIILIALMLSISGYSAGIIPGIISRAEVSLHGIVAAEDLRSSLIKLPITATGNRIECSTSSVQRGSISVADNLCYQFPDNSPLLNIDELTQVKCAGIKAHTDRTTLHGNPLSSGSIISKYVCSSFPLGFSKTDILIGNFEKTLPHTMTNDLSVSGYFNVPGVFGTSGDYGVLAGGDVRIGNIVSLDSFPHIVYLHSRTGIISVGSVAAEITIYCQAHSHNCPQTQLGPNWAPVAVNLSLPISYLN